MCIETNRFESPYNIHHLEIETMIMPHGHGIIISIVRNNVIRPSQNSVTTDGVSKFTIKHRIELN